jgi:hypothetical protein
LGPREGATLACGVGGRGRSQFPRRDRNSGTLCSVNYNPSTAGGVGEVKPTPCNEGKIEREFLKLFILDVHCTVCPFLVHVTPKDEDLTADVNFFTFFQKDKIKVQHGDFIKRLLKVKP